MKNTFLKIAFILLSLTLLSTSCSGDDNKQKDSITSESLHGKWIVTNMEGKLFVSVGNIPEVEAPLMTFWSGKTFYFENENRLSVLDGQTELFDFGPYTLNGNKLTVANGPGVLQVNKSGSETMTLTNKQDDYYKMMSFYTGQSESEIRQMYRVQGDIIYHLKKQ